MDHKADIGLIGLAVMGENLVLNLERNGFSVAIFNRHTNKVDSFIRGRGNGKKIIPCYSSAELCAALTSPRRSLLMVKAGDPVDELIATLLPHLDPGDILIDGAGGIQNGSTFRNGDRFTVDRQSYHFSILPPLKIP